MMSVLFFALFFHILKQVTIMFSKKKIWCYVVKIFICIILLLILLIFFKKDPYFKMDFYKKVFETNISFAQINQIYEKYMGSSIPFKDYFVKTAEPVFEETLTYHSSSSYLDGTKLMVDDNYLVPVLEGGLVIFVGEKEGYGNTVIIGQSNGIDVWYSNIENIAVSLYDYVEKGSFVGNCKGDYFYLVFKKDGQVLNYEEYI